MRQNPHVRICGGPGSATTLVYPTANRIDDRCDTCHEDCSESRLRRDLRVLVEGRLFH